MKIEKMAVMFVVIMACAIAAKFSYAMQSQAASTPVPIVQQQ